MARLRWILTVNILLAMVAVGCGDTDTTQDPDVRFDASAPPGDVELDGGAPHSDLGASDDLGGSEPPDPLPARPILQPAVAKLALGDEQAFRLVAADGSEVVTAVTWTVDFIDEADSADPGVIDTTGRYTAPTALLDPPVVLVQATVTVEDIGEVTLEARVDLVAAGEALLTREQATEQLQLTVLTDSALIESPNTVTALGWSEPLRAGDEILPAAPPDDEGGPWTEPLVIEADTWFYLVDLHPGTYWAHPVLYVLVRADSGETTSIHAEWYPLVNGMPLFPRPAEAFMSPLQVFEGEDASRDHYEESRRYAEETLEWFENLPSTKNANFYNVDDLFPFWTSQSCPCDDPRRVALIIQGMHLDDTSYSDTSVSRRVAEAIFRGALGFDEVIVRSPAKEHLPPFRMQLADDLAELVRTLRPCDVFVLYVISHGDKRGFLHIQAEPNWKFDAGTGTIQHLFTHWIRIHQISIIT